jgi:GT2 family glycosyltransferase
MSPSKIHRLQSTGEAPLASIVVLNHNGAMWLRRCFASLREQTIVSRLEIVLVDNCSTDESVPLALELLADFPCACVVANETNLGFCEGNNSGARAAQGRWLFFLNNDTWLEPDCMERLVGGTEAAGAVASTPYVLNYPDSTFQDFGFYGFDVFGLPSPSSPVPASREIFIPGGCSYFIRTDVFKAVGMFDREFFIYSDDADLAWRVWIAGHKVAGIVPARVHHRGAAGVNPAGGITTVEFRTTDRKRFLTNRNCLLTLLKNGQHILLLSLLPLAVLLLLEALAGALILRRASFVRASFWDPIADCWRLRGHVREQRRHIAAFRKRSDFWMLRFLRWLPNRSGEIKRLFQFGLPRVDAR